MDQVFLDDDESWVPFYETPAMAPTYSHHSIESGLESSPSSWQDPSYLNNQRFPQAGLSASPLISPTVSFEQTQSFGTWADETSFEPLILNEANLSFEQPLSMFHQAAEPRYSQSGTELAGSYESSGGTKCHSRLQMRLRAGTAVSRRTPQRKR